MMNGSDLLDIPLLGEMVAEEVQRFAVEHGLICRSWYHGEPMWIIEEEKTSARQFFRELQIAVFRTARGERLFLIPQGLRLKKDGTWESICLEESITSYALSMLLPVDESTRKKLDILIAYAWLVAETLQEKDLSTG